MLTSHVMQSMSESDWFLDPSAQGILVVQDFHACMNSGGAHISGLDVRP